MTAILFIWTIVGYTHYSSLYTTKRDWRPLGEFSSQEYCQRAAMELGLDKDKFRCVVTGFKEKAK